MNRILLQLWHEETAFENDDLLRKISWSSVAKQTLDAIEVEVFALEVSKDFQDRNTLRISAYMFPAPAVGDS